jgi:hypothetical protein
MELIDGARKGRRAPGRTEVLVRAELTLKFVVRRMVKREPEDGGGEAQAWERDGESVNVRVGQSSPVRLPFGDEDPAVALFDAATDLIPADVVEDEDRILRTVTAAAEDTLLSVTAKGEL